jgi:hypothetical protein
MAHHDFFHRGKPKQSIHVFEKTKIIYVKIR